MNFFFFLQVPNLAPRSYMGMYIGKGLRLPSSLIYPRFGIKNSPNNTLLLLFNHFFPLLQVGYGKLNTDKVFFYR